MTLFKMDTADDTSETQSQAHNELLWDHTGDVESDPLLAGEAGRQIMPQRPDTVQLSYEQAMDLLKVLNNTRSVLEAFVGQVQENGGDQRRVRQSWWATHCFPAQRRSVAKYIFIITAALQAVNLLVVSILDVIPREDDRPIVTGTGVVMILLQLVNLFFIVIVSMRLVRQLYKHKVSVWLMAQSYISTLLLFAGIYTLTYRLESKSWKFIEEDLEQNPILVIELYSKFLFFSVSTATLCGSDNVLPKDWYNCIFTAAQMLMSFVYFASILGHTLSQDTQYWLGVGAGQHRSSPATEGPGGARVPNSVFDSTARVSGLTSHVNNYSSTVTLPMPASPRDGGQGSGRDGKGGEDGGLPGGPGGGSSHSPHQQHC